MDRREKKIRDSQLSQEQTDQDGFVDLNMVNNNKILPNTVINKVLDLGERFNKERQTSTYYRIFGTINPAISNPLFDLDGENSWSTFNTTQLRDESYPPDGSNDLTYIESVDKYLDEQNGWFGYVNDDLTADTSVCQFIQMSPSRDEFTFDPVGDDLNWDMTVTYPYSGITGHVVDGGILIVDDFTVNVGGRNLVAFVTPIAHNLNGGDLVKLTGLDPSSLDGEYRVQRIGDDSGNLKSHYFAVDIEPGQLNDSTDARMVKIVGGFESDYYYRVFKKIKTRKSSMINEKDHETYRPSFLRNFYNDDVTQFVFNEDVDVSDLRDNLGRPLSELYVTIIKRNNKGFTDVKSGFDMPYLFDATQSKTEIPHINRITLDSSNTHDHLEDNITINDDEFIGDVVEYNVTTLKEVTLSRVAHTFNRDSRLNSVTLSNTGDGEIDIGPRIEGYYYLPHHLYKIRNFSTYIEQGNENTVGIPDYAENLGDGRILWRDLLDIGFSSGEDQPVDYPFLNGVHYLHNCFIFELKRQDPFNLFGLYYVKDGDSRIRDPFGIQMVDDFDVNRSEDVC